MPEFKTTKLYNVNPEAVSFIIGKEGKNIKNIIGKVGNGAFIQYQKDKECFSISCYSAQCINQIIRELSLLEELYEKNRKKYVTYTFENKVTDHQLVTHVIQTLKEFPNSPYVEYKSDGVFVLSNYNKDTLNSMLDKLKSLDDVNSPLGFSSWKVVEKFIQDNKNTTLPKSTKPKIRLDEFTIDSSNSSDIIREINTYLDDETCDNLIILRDEDLEYVLNNSNF
jgi:hypothetical protein